MKTTQDVLAEIEKATSKASTTVKADKLTPHVWVAVVTHQVSRTLMWHFDLAAFRIAMIGAAAACVRAVQWADEVSADRIRQREIERAQAALEPVTSIYTVDDHRLHIHSGSYISDCMYCRGEEQQHAKGFQEQFRREPYTCSICGVKELQQRMAITENKLPVSVLTEWCSYQPNNATECHHLCCLDHLRQWEERQALPEGLR